jgi:hypothetical protein
MIESDIHKSSCLGNQKTVKSAGHYYNHLFHTLKKKTNLKQRIHLENKLYVTAYDAIIA